MSSAMEIYPKTLAEDPRRQAVVNFYADTVGTPDEIKDSLAERYSGMSTGHIVSTTTAIMRRRAAKQKG